MGRFESPNERNSPIRDGAEEHLEACIELWVRACAARDGERVSGVAQRARVKFGARALWHVAARDGQVEGFVLATVPGSGAASDPPTAAVIGLLAVDPNAQARGIGRRLLRSATAGLGRLGYQQAVLHVLVDNTAAIRLYESEGWAPRGTPFEHPLLHRLSQTYSLALSGEGWPLQTVRGSRLPTAPGER